MSETSFCNWAGGQAQPEWPELPAWPYSVATFAGEGLQEDSATSRKARAPEGLPDAGAGCQREFVGAVGPLDATSREARAVAAATNAAGSVGQAAQEEPSVATSRDAREQKEETQVVDEASPVACGTPSDATSRTARVEEAELAVGSGVRVELVALPGATSRKARDLSTAEMEEMEKALAAQLHQAEILLRSLGH